MPPSPTPSQPAPETAGDSPSLVASFQAAAKRSWPAALGYEILLKLLGAALLAPLSAWLLASLLSSAGRVAISNAEILAFLQSPTGALAVNLVFIAATLTMLVEQAGLMWIAHAGISQGSPTMLRAVGRVMSRLVALLQLAVLLSIVFTLCAIPFLLIGGLTYATLLTDHDINYYVNERPPAFWTAVSIGGICAAALGAIYTVLYVRWIFALPACVVSGQAARTALATSWRLTRGHFWRLALALGGFSAAMAGIGGSIDFVARMLERWALDAAGENLNVVLPTVAGLLTLDLLLITVVSALGIAFFCLLVVLLYHRAVQAAGEPELLASGDLPGERAPLRWKRRTLYAAAALFLLVSTSLAWIVAETLTEVPPVQITAHRGASRSAPENTLAAIRAAIEVGADVAEIDVQETADGQIVVLHDSDLQRITGQRGNIWEVPYDEVAQLDAGGWFSEDFRGERIPRLDELLELAKDKIRLNIELKFNGHDQDLTAQVVRLLREADMVEQCFLTSSNYKALVKAQQLEPKLRTGLIIFESVGDITALDVDLLSVNQKTVTRDLVGSAHRHAKQVHAWTVNKPQRMEQLIGLGVDNLITDAPAEAIAVRADRAELSAVERVLLVLRDIMQGNRR